jgi:D-erythronate 2-dehydrogenase
MRVLITGGAGFLGMKLANAILRRGALTDAMGGLREITEIALLDQTAPQVPIDDARVKVIVGDITQAEVLRAALSAPTGSVFHLAAIVSGQAEAEFDLGMRVNFDATRLLLDGCRTLAAPTKFLFTSSIAVFGGALPPILPDDQALTPQGSYGAQKAMGELLVCDMSRKGFIDGRVLRLPTVTVRPGKPNKAASSFASGMIREPLAGVAANVPVSPETKMWVQSPDRVIENILMGHETPASFFDRPLPSLGSQASLSLSPAAIPASAEPLAGGDAPIPAAQFRSFPRTISVPGISVSIGEMAASLRRVAGDEVADRLTWNREPAIENLVNTWPQAFSAERGRAMGMVADKNFDEMVRSHMAAMAAA